MDGEGDERPGPGGDKHTGRTLHGTFVLDRVLGEGGMGVVYTAHNAKTPTIKYAVKLLRRDSALDVQRFRREAQALAALEHPAIVRPVHVDVSDEGEPYLVMEYVRGTPLRDKLIEAKGAGLDAKTAMAVLDGIAEALDHAHARGVIHRDLKPENVLVLEGGRRALVKVLDFGIAKILAPDGSAADTLTQTREVAGTVAYMSPEQCREMRTAGPPSDRFTLGVMAYELLSGKRPFDGPNAPSTVANILLNALPPAPLTDAGYGPAVLAVLQRATSKNAAERFESACGFVETLAAAVEESVGPAVLRSSSGGASLTSSQPRVSSGGSTAASVSAVRTPTEQVEPTLPAGPAPWGAHGEKPRDSRKTSAPPPSDDAALVRTMAPSSPARSRGLAWLAVVAVIAVPAGLGLRAWRTPAVPPARPSASPASESSPARAADACGGASRPATAGFFDDESCVAGGPFVMGSPESEGDSDEHPRRTVTLAPFYLDRYEVTVARFRRCVVAGACDSGGLDSEGPTDAQGHYDPRGGRLTRSAHCTYRDTASANDALPINCVSHAQAAQVCRFEGRRLASEAEWERAARGGGEAPRAYPWGDAPPDCTRASYGLGAVCRLADPTTVGTARAGVTPEGVFDLAGNVAEWTADWYSTTYYGHAPASDPPGPAPDEARAQGGDPVVCRDGCRVTRGGAWNTPASLVVLLRASHRSADASNRRAAHLGVRCARTP